MILITIEYKLLCNSRTSKWGPGGGTALTPSSFLIYFLKLLLLPHEVVSITAFKVKFLSFFLYLGFYNLIKKKLTLLVSSQELSLGPILEQLQDINI